MRFKPGQQVQLKEELTVGKRVYWLDTPVERVYPIGTQGIIVKVEGDLIELYILEPGGGLVEGVTDRKLKKSW
jgi:hypothetical protein